MKLLPPKIIFDLGVGNSQMGCIESFGFRGACFMSGPKTDRCPTSEKAGAAFLLDVIEHCVNQGLGLKVLPML
jgi:hypothetical protein